MELMHRFGGKVDKEYVDFYIKLIKEHKGSGDNVWIGTPYGFPTLEYHRKNADFLIESAKKIRESGISVSLQVSNTLGHSDNHGIADGLVYEGSKAVGIVGPDGTQCHQCWCYNSQAVIDYTVAELKMYAEIKPDVAWVDDDFRAENHGPVRNGCFCPDCIAKFNAKYGTNYDRDGLVNAILKDLEVRAKWEDFKFESLGNFLYQISLAIHEVSPNTKIGIQNPHVMYGDKNNELLNAVKKATGMMPTVRPGGGFYIDYIHEALFDKGSHIAFQNATIPEEIKVRAAEQESLPFSAMNKTAEMNALESCWHTANGCTDLSYSILMHKKDVDKYYDDLMGALASCRKFYDTVGKINEYTHSAGVRQYISKNLRFCKDDGVGTYDERLMKCEYITSAGHTLESIQRDGFPIAFDYQDESLTIIGAEMASALSQEEVDYLLTKNCYVDGESIAILKDKLNIGITAEKVMPPLSLTMKEVFTDHPTKEEGLNEWSYSFYSRVGRQEVYKLTDNTGKAEIISYYLQAKNSLSIDEMEKNNEGIAELIIDTGKGGKWAINGYKPWVRSVTQYKRNQMLNVMDYVSGDKLCVKPMSERPIIIFPRENKYGKIVCISFINYSVGTNTETIFVRKMLTNKFKFMDMHGKMKKVKAKPYKDGFIITLPPLDSFIAGVLLCK